MSIMTKPSGEARTAIAFITIGTLVAVWSGIWYAYLRNYPSENPAPYYFCSGFFLSGVVLIVVGMGIGKIGRAARQAELPPQEITGAVVNVDQNAAERAPIVAPLNPTQPGGLPGPAIPVATSDVVANPRNVPVSRN
jgi:hypothetical protein